MASITIEIQLAADPGLVWDAVRDFGAVHRRLAVGFVTAARLDGQVRTVTFFNGLTAQERLVTCDDAARRLVYTASGGRTTHYNAAVQVIPSGRDCRLTWTIDLLPDELEGPIRAMAERGAEAIKRTLEQAAGLS
jgi:carbon monoxide dehydrogenase subunit G